MIGRDRKIGTDRGGIVIGGNVSGSNIISGNNNQVQVTIMSFKPIYRAVEEIKLPPQDKEDLKATIKEVEDEVKKGDEADETFLAR